MNNDRVLWLDGQLVPERDARASLLEHGLHYGTGVFEGIRCYETADGAAVFRLDEHLARMEQGARSSGCGPIERSSKRRSSGCCKRTPTRRLAFACRYGAGSLGLDVGPVPSHGRDGAVVVAPGDAAGRRNPRPAPRQASLGARCPAEAVRHVRQSVIAKRSYRLPLL